MLPLETRRLSDLDQMARRIAAQTALNPGMNLKG
jgi:hypothetical protein